MKPFTFDAHIHMVNREFYWGGSIADRKPNGQVDLPRLIEGGIDALFFSLFVTEEYYGRRYETKQALRLMDLAHRELEAHKDQIRLAFTASDIEAIVRGGRIAAVLDMEGSIDLDGDLGVLREFYAIGLRAYQLPAHNAPNNYADSCCSAPRWSGINDRGRALIAEMNRLGMVINVSHASDQTIEQAIEASAHPIVATHHGLREFNNIPRNMPTWLLEKLARSGGLIGIQIGNEFHNPPVFNWRASHAGKPFWDTARISEEAIPIESVDDIVRPQFPMEGCAAPEDIRWTVDDWLQVTDRVIELVGDDHVIFGTDFDGGPTLPLPLRDVRDTQLIPAAMLRRGYSSQRIAKIMGGNLLRVFRLITENYEAPADNKEGNTGPTPSSM